MGDPKNNDPRYPGKVSLKLWSVGFVCCLILVVGRAWSFFAAAPWGNPVPGDLRGPDHYYARTLSFREGRDAFQKLTLAQGQSESAARELLRIVSQSFIHKADGPYYLGFFDNWIMWVRSLTDPRAKISQDGEFLWRVGYGFCDQAATVYVSLAKQLGFRARILWLEGHVVAEVLVPNLGGRIVDPDLGIWWDFSSAELAQGISQTRIANEILAAGYDNELAQKIAQIYVSTEDNKLTALPYLPELYRFEAISSWLSLLLPSLGLLWCGGCLLHSRAYKNSTR
jgi:hypothetical protein